jgi:hypothetical protein
MSSNIESLTTKMQSLKVDSTPWPRFESITIKTPKDAMTASIHILFNHVADFHELIVRIISEKYKIPVEDMMKTITEHPDYKSMTVHPTLASFGFFEQSDADAVMEPAAKRARVDESATTAVKRKLKIVKKK